MAETINIRKIAELAQCSPSTVSRVLSDKVTGIKISAETRARIWEVCRELDYQPSVHAIRLFSKRARSIGFLPSRECFILDDNLARSMNTVFLELNRYGYRCLPLINDDRFMQEREYINLFKRKEIDALIVWGASEDSVWLRELEYRQLPFMLLTNRYESYPAVSCDNKNGIAQMVEHCRQRGAKRLAYLHIARGDSCLQRHAGFLEAAAGCQTRVINVDKFGIEDGHAAAPAILEFKPDAVICANDRLAFGLERTLLQAGIRIPEDLLITGGDNIEMAQYAPVPLTTFDQMAEDCAAACVDILLKHLDHNEPLRSAVIPPHLHVRTSA